MPDFDGTLSAQYINGETIDFAPTIFELTNRQKNSLKNYISKHTPTELKESPYKMKLSSQQKRDILNFHKAIMGKLKAYFKVNGSSDLAKILLKRKIIIFSTHAVERLKERFSTADKDNPFYKLKLLGNISINTLQQDALEVFVEANQIGNNVEWRNTPYCVINYSVEGDQTVLSVETQFDRDFENAPYIVITVMKKKYKNV